MHAHTCAHTHTHTHTHIYIHTHIEYYLNSSRNTEIIVRKSFKPLTYAWTVLHSFS